VSLKVFDILGNEVATLVNEEKAPGIYKIDFSSEGNASNYNLSSGIYFYKLSVTGVAGNFIKARKMTLLK
jgi:hypothetical protein